VYPWNVELRWQPLLGAARFDVHFTSSPPDGIDRNGAVLGDQTHLVRSFSAANDAPNRYTWRVIALGPPLGSAEEPEPPESAEEAQPSLTRTINVDKPATRVQLVSPIYDSVVKGCQEASVVVQWAEVPSATGYRITIYPVRTDFQMPPNDQVGNIAVYETTIPAPRISATLTGPVVSPDRSAPNVVGYHALVQAIGPDQAGGAPGNKNSNSGRYYLRPSTPIPLDPLAADVPWSEHYLHMLWAVGFTPGGMIEIETHYYPSCTGSANNSTILANHYGATAYETGPRDAGSTSSWRARPAYAGHCSFANIAWSPCTDYTIPSGPLSYGTCGSVFNTETGDVAGRTVEVDLGANDTSAAIVFNTLNIPDRMVVRRGATILVDTGCVSTNDGCPAGCPGSGGTCWCPFDSGPNNDTVTVVATTNCGAPNQSETLWSFQIACLGDAEEIGLDPGAE
jgi:hypothetical protein